MVQDLFHILTEGVQSGPFTLGQLRSMWSEGQITATALYWTEIQSDWQPILQLASLLEPTLETRAIPTVVVAAQWPPKARIGSRQELSPLVSIDLLTDLRNHPLGYCILGLGFVGMVLSFLGGAPIFHPIYLGVIVWLGLELLMNVGGLAVFGASASIFPHDTNHLAGVTFWIAIILVFCEARQLRMGGELDKTAEEKVMNRPSSWIAGMFFVWIVYFPLYMYRRGRYGAKNLLGPTVAVFSPIIVSLALFYIGMWWRPSLPDVPRVDAPEIVESVQHMIERAVEKNQSSNAPVSIVVSEPIQVSYDDAKQRRVARAIITAKGESATIYFSIEWQDRGKGIYQIQIIDHE